jgi:hypothetical protein
LARRQDQAASKLIVLRQGGGGEPAAVVAEAVGLELVDLLGSGVVCIGTGDQGHLFPFAEREVKPPRAIGIASGSLAAALLDGMGYALGPFRFGMIKPTIAIDAQRPVRGRSKRESRASAQSVSMGREVVIRAAVALGFPMKIPIFKVDSNREPHQTIVRQLRLGSGRVERT